MLEIKKIKRRKEGWYVHRTSNYIDHTQINVQSTCFLDRARATVSEWIVTPRPSCCAASDAFTVRGSSRYRRQSRLVVNTHASVKEQSQGRVSERPSLGTGSSKTWLLADSRTTWGLETIRAVEISERIWGKREIKIIITEAWLITCHLKFSLHFETLNFPAELHSDEKKDKVRLDKTKTD